MAGSGVRILPVIKRRPSSAGESDPSKAFEHAERKRREKKNEILLLLAFRPAPPCAGDAGLARLAADADLARTAASSCHARSASNASSASSAKMPRGSLP